MNGAPKWDAKHPVAPFDRDGNLLHYPDHWRGLEWREVPRYFNAELTIKDYCRGRSAAYFELADDEGRTYPMFLKDFTCLVKRASLQEGRTVCTQTWRYLKRGQNYGIALDDD